ncbi:MAG: endonuclease/exonuclease/phosphatase family protein [Candidatus Pacebacteria bacterium]|nr:endonuclease/exonuclease/phosphatase family protein [Candidatus Paceibacterota bacterium]
MKIISFNIGIRIDNAKTIAEYLKSQNADIVCLQEAVRPLDKNVFHTYRSEEFIREYFEKEYPHYFFAPEWVADCFLKEGKVDRNLGGMAEQGKLILSKFPIIHGDNYFYYKVYEFERDRTHFWEGDDHGRSLQVCEIDVNGKTIQLGNVHGSYSKNKMDNERSLAQSDFIVKKLKEKKLPTILLGDFNALPETESISKINKVYKNLNQEFNISATRLKGQNIDYVFINDSFKANSLIVDIVNISDHYPLIADLELIPAVQPL